MAASKGPDPAQQKLLQQDALAGDTAPQLAALSGMAVQFNARTHFLDEDEPDVDSTVPEHEQ